MQKVQVLLLDDVNGGDADETILFALDNISYEIDLSAQNAAELRNAFSRYLPHARRTGGRARTTSGGARRREQAALPVEMSPTRQEQASPKEVRAWAASNGIEVSDRGRVPVNVMAQFQAARQ